MVRWILALGQADEAQQRVRDAPAGGQDDVDELFDDLIGIGLAVQETPRHDADQWFWGSPLFDRLGRFAGLDDEMPPIPEEGIIVEEVDWDDDES